MIVNVYNEQDIVLISSSQVSALVKSVLLEEGVSCNEVNLYFVDTPTICQLHADFFNDPTPTDCITFPLDSDDDIFSNEKHLGEVFVCPQTAEHYVAESGGSLYQEISLYVVHGLLHLIGYDDIEEEDIVVMRALEKTHMKLLEDKNLLLSQ